MQKVRYTSTVLRGNKKGILPKDENGYYSIPVGGLNVYNSVGEFYALEGAKQLFDSSSAFMRRVQNGCLKAEVGHPKQEPGMTIRDYIKRILTIEERNICGHFGEIWLDEEFGRTQTTAQNKSVVAIMGKVRPSGEKGIVLETALNNPRENVCFSIRALTENFVKGGVTVRVLDTVVTFDLVNEGGIAHANKFSSPALESNEEQTFFINQLEDIYKAHLKDPVAAESSTLLKEILDRANEISKRPIYSNW